MKRLTSFVLALGLALAVFAGEAGAQNPTNLLKINGTQVSTGPGSADAGTLRVALSSDASLSFSGNAAASNTGAAVPAAAGYTGVNVGGTLTGVTATNNSGKISMDVNITGGSSGNGAASNAGSAVPTQAGYTGINVGGTLRGATGAARGSEFAISVQIVDAAGAQITSFGSGTVTANAGTNLNTSLLALESGGNLASAATSLTSLTARTADYDTGAGTATTVMTGIALPASGGPVAGFTTTNPGIVQLTGTNNVTNAGTFATQSAITAASGSIVAGAIANGADVAEGLTTDNRCTTTDTTACTLVGLAKQLNFLINTPTGQQTMANSNSVTIASNQTEVAVGGGVASGNADSGNPAKIGGRFNTTPPTLSNGNRGDLQLDSRGSARTVISDGAANARYATVNANNQLDVAIGNNVTLAAGTNNIGVTGYAQGATTLGEVGPLVQCAVTTSAPTYTNAQTDPFSCDTTGAVRVSVVSGSTGNAAASATGSAVPAQADYIGGNVSGTLRGITATNVSGSTYGLDVNVVGGSAGNGAASNTAAAVPAQADYLGLNVAGTLRGQTGVNPSGSIFAAQSDIASVAGTTIDVNSGTKSAGTIRVVIATDQPQLTNKLLVTPDANSAVNIGQVGGASVSTAASGVQKVGITGNAGAAMDAAGQNATSPANELLVGCQFNTTPTTITSTNMSPVQCNNLGHVLVTPDANAAINVAQVNGGTVATGNGTVNSNTQRVAIASDNTPFSVNAVGTLSSNGAAATTNRVGTLPAIAESNMPSAQTAGRDVALRTDLNGNLITSVVPSGFTTYAASKQGLVPASTPTDIAVLPGNATNTVIVTGVTMSCTQTTAGIIDVMLLKRSAADTGGTSGAMTVVPLDSGNAAGVSAPLTYTANPSTGTLVGNVDTQKIGVMAAGTASPNDIYVWKPTMGQSVVLRGTAQQLAINLNSVTLTGGSCDINFTWIETTGL